MSKCSTIALVEFRNCQPFIYRIVSDSPINIDRVAKHFEISEEWDEARDNITLIDDLTEIDLDRSEKTRKAMEDLSRLDEEMGLL